MAEQKHILLQKTMKESLPKLRVLITGFKDFHNSKQPCILGFSSSPDSVARL